MGRRSRALAGVAALAAVVVALYGLTHCGVISGKAPSFFAGGAHQLDEVELPPGFTVTLFAHDVEGARSLALGPEGLVFVGTRKAGKVYALVDRDGDGVAEETKIIAQGLESPNGVAYRDGHLYVAEIARILRFDDIATKLDAPPKPKLVSGAFPGEEHHGWKFIAFGPDGLLYVPVGAPCNVCDPEDERFSTIMRLKPDGSGLEIFARGIRNTVGFDWEPASGVLWFTDNGRDWLGDDRPPDELNRAPRAGMHFGFPYCHGRAHADPDHDRLSCRQTVPPEVELDAHVAALGMRFYRGTRFPEPWRQGIFWAEHGSWNRTAPAGYRVMFVPVRDGRAGEPRVFAGGWLKGAAAWGRPVDVLELADGSLLVSDDKAGVVYRIDYAG
jgi:glucose/arabinose dehydrogenase